MIEERSPNSLSIILLFRLNQYALYWLSLQLWSCHPQSLRKPQGTEIARPKEIPKPRHPISPPHWSAYRWAQECWRWCRWRSGPSAPSSCAPFLSSSSWCCSSCSPTGPACACCRCRTHSSVLSCSAFDSKRNNTDQAIYQKEMEERFDSSHHVRLRTRRRSWRAREAKQEDDCNGIRQRNGNNSGERDGVNDSWRDIYQKMER